MLGHFHHDGLLGIVVSTRIKGLPTDTDSSARGQCPSPTSKYGSYDKHCDEMKRKDTQNEIVSQPISNRRSARKNVVLAFPDDDGLGRDSGKMHPQWCQQ